MLHTMSASAVGSTTRTNGRSAAAAAAVLPPPPLLSSPPQAPAPALAACAATSERFWIAKALMMGVLLAATLLFLLGTRSCCFDGGDCERVNRATTDPRSGLCSGAADAAAGERILAETCKLMRTYISDFVHNGVCFDWV
jgi:hypothetical protein